MLSWLLQLWCKIHRNKMLVLMHYLNKRLPWYVLSSMQCLVLRILNVQSIGKTLNNENNVKISITFVCVLLYWYVRSDATIWKCPICYHSYFLLLYFSTDCFCLTYTVKYICMIIDSSLCRLKVTFIECCSKNRQLYFKRRVYLLTCK